MAFVVGVRWALRGKDAGRPDSGGYRVNRGHSHGASSAARRHNRYLAKGSSGPVEGRQAPAAVTMRRREYVT
jgi:hypothetical protein